MKSPRYVPAMNERREVGMKMMMKMKMKRMAGVRAAFVIRHSSFGFRHFFLFFKSVISLSTAADRAFGMAVK